MTASGNDAAGVRAQVLAKIGAPAKEGMELAQAYLRIQREYKRVGSLDLVQRLEMLAERLREYDASVYRSTPEDLARTIVEPVGALAAADFQSGGRGGEF